jgi:hypothetical protein
MRVEGEVTYAHGVFRFYQFVKDCLLFFYPALLQHHELLSAASNEKALI